MVRFKMLGRDVNSAPTQYRTWVVPNTPDLTGALYTGLKSGPNPMVDISAYTVLDDNAIVDFNLSLPAQWQTIPDTPFDFAGRKVLPEEVSDSCLAIINGFAYMFGSKKSKAIYRANLNNPGDWVDTGATLPVPIPTYNQSLAIVGDTIYLFGGNQTDVNGVAATDHILTAPVSNPLVWTDQGALLPRKVHSSHLGMANGYLFLAGGQDINNASDLILTASTVDPLTWTVASGTLPSPLYGGTIMQSEGFWYILGGQIFPDSPVNTIYRAPVTAPTIWQPFGNIPYPSSYGAFFPYGNDGYYIGPASGDGYDTSTFTPIVQVPLNSITQWIDPKQFVPAVLSHSQTAIIYDRLWFFGGSGMSAIFACQQVLKYPFNFPTAVAYGNVTRMVFPNTDNLNNPFEALGIPYWVTDYKM